MSKDDTIILLRINDQLIAEEIQRLLEGSGIYSILSSDNPASSIMNAYTGFRPSETVEVVVNKLDYQQAAEILSSSPYRDLFYH